MNRWLAVIFCLMLTAETVLPADVDSVRANLDKAKARYESAAVKYRLDVSAWFDTQEKAARGRGAKKAVDDLQAEREAFERKGKAPKSAPSRFRTQLSKPRSTLEKKYETAIQDYTKANLDKEAAAVEKELAAFKAAAGLPPDDAESFSGKRYKVFNTMLTWQDAKAECEKMGGRLAIITSIGENDFVRKLADKSKVKVIWLGATDEQKEGNWQWIDGSAVKYDNWDTSTNQPNNAQGVEHYVVLLVHKQGVWYDYPAIPKDFPNLTAQGLPGFVCEWD